MDKIEQNKAEIERRLENSFGKALCQIERLQAALLSADCPGGGFTGMPKDAEATVALCLEHGVCGCNLGRTLEGKNE